MAGEQDYARAFINDFLTKKTNRLSLGDGKFPESFPLGVADNSIYVLQLQESLRHIGLYEGKATRVLDNYTMEALAAYLEKNKNIIPHVSDTFKLRDEIGKLTEKSFFSNVFHSASTIDPAHLNKQQLLALSYTGVEETKALQKLLHVPQTGVRDGATLDAIIADIKQNPSELGTVGMPVLFDVMKYKGRDVLKSAAAHSPEYAARTGALINESLNTRGISATTYNAQVLLMAGGYYNPNHEAASGIRDKDMDEANNAFWKSHPATKPGSHETPHKLHTEVAENSGDITKPANGPLVASAPGIPLKPGFTG